MSDGLTIEVEASVVLQADYTDEEVKDALNILGADDTDTLVEHTQTNFRQILASELDEDELESLTVEAREVEDE